MCVTDAESSRQYNHGDHDVEITRYPEELPTNTNLGNFFSLVIDILCN